MFYSPARFNDDENFRTIPLHGVDPYRQINYDLCTALDLTKMGIVLDKMVAVGMNPQLRELYEAQTGSLLALLRSENNRLFGV